MKLYISHKTRKALLDKGFSRQTINNWKAKRCKPSRIARAIINDIITMNSLKRRKN